MEELVMVYKGKGSPTEEDRVQLAQMEGLTILKQPTPRVHLVTYVEDLTKLRELLPMWAIGPNRQYDLA